MELEFHWLSFLLGVFAQLFVVMVCTTGLRSNFQKGMVFAVQLYGRISVASMSAREGLLSSDEKAEYVLALLRTIVGAVENSDDTYISDDLLMLISNRSSQEDTDELLNFTIGVLKEEIERVNAKITKHKSRCADVMISSLKRSFDEYRSLGKGD